MQHPFVTNEFQDLHPTHHLEIVVSSLDRKQNNFEFISLYCFFVFSFVADIFLFQEPSKDVALTSKLYTKIM